jgi:hypothetical protein
MLFAGIGGCIGNRGLGRPDRRAHNGGAAAGIRGDERLGRAGIYRKLRGSGDDHLEQFGE